MIIFPVSNFKSSSSFSAEYQAVYDSFTTPPSGAIAAEQNTMVEALVVAGVWTKLACFYVMAQSTNGGGEALINWINPGTYDLSLYGGTDPTFTALEGFTALIPQTAGMDTQYDPSIHGGSIYTLNAASFGYYCRTNSDGNFVDMGIEETNDAWIYSRTGNSCNFRINIATTDFNAGQTDSSGFYICVRTAANASTLYRNGSVLGTNAGNSTALPARSFYIGARHGAAGPSNTTGRQYSIGFVGGVLDNTEQTAFTAAVEAYMDSNSKGVIS